MKPGVVVLGAHRVYVDDPFADQNNLNYVAVPIHTLPTQDKLPGEGFSGYSLEVHAPVKLKAVMKPYH